MLFSGNFEENYDAILTQILLYLEVKNDNIIEQQQKSAFFGLTDVDPETRKSHGKQLFRGEQ